MGKGDREDHRSLIANGEDWPLSEPLAEKSASGLEVVAVGQGAEPPACKNGLDQWVEVLLQRVMPRSTRRGYDRGPTDGPWGLWCVPGLTGCGCRAANTGLCGLAQKGAFSQHLSRKHFLGLDIQFLHQSHNFLDLPAGPPGQLGRLFHRPSLTQ